MNVRASWKKAVAGLAVLTAALTVFAAPASALSDDVMAYSLDESGHKVAYYTTGDAIEAGYAGKTIYLNVDWKFIESMDVAEDKSITINMNGHYISVSEEDNSVITMGEGSTLTLTSDKEATFTYTAADAEEGDRKQSTITTGGLIKDGYSYNNAGGILMRDDCTLNLDNVAIAGNVAWHGAGVYADENCNINMTNGASIEHNFCNTDGGGVYASDEDCNIRLNNSFISDNYTANFGGGVCSVDDATRVYLENGSSISGNTSAKGGALAFTHSYFCVVSNDGTGSVKNNKVKWTGSQKRDWRGGAIYVEYHGGEGNEGSIRGLAISGNSAKGQGGALFIAQANIEVSDCTITGNKAGDSGGGIYVNNSGISVNSCTITGNVCNVAPTSDSDSDEGDGGGIYVPIDRDLKMTGRCTVAGNARSGDSTPNDLYPGYTVGQRSYITGGLDDGSSVGVISSCWSEYRFGKNINNASDDCFFADDDEWYVTCGTDEGGDMWLRKGSKHDVKINGTKVGEYEAGEMVTLDGGSCASQGQTFYCWDEDGTKGLEPFSSYVGYLYTRKISFTMPDNDVDLAANYTNYITSVSVTADVPVAGEALPATATVALSNATILEVPVTWLAEDGSVATEAVGGQSYRLSLKIAQDCPAGRIFDPAFDPRGVTSTWTGAAAESASVGEDGSLSVTFGPLEAKGSIASLEPISVCVKAGASKADILKEIPSYATATLVGGSTKELDIVTDSIAWPGGLFDSDGNVVSSGRGKETYTGRIPLEDNGDVTDAASHYVELDILVLDSDYHILSVNGATVGSYVNSETVYLNGDDYAPEGKAFKCWSNKSKGFPSSLSDQIGEGNMSSSSISISMPDGDANLVAEYVDTATAVEVTVDKPVAGERLPTVATVKLSTGNTRKVPITWCDQDGKISTTAGWGAAYSFSFSLAKSIAKNTVFDRNLTESGVTIKWTDSEEGPLTASASVSSAGALNVTSGTVTTDKAEVKSVEAASVTVSPGASRDELLAALPETASATVSGDRTVTLATDKSGAIAGLDALLAEDGTVADPGDEPKDHTVELPLAAADGVANPDSKTLAVTVTVLPGEKVAAPTLSIGTGTYYKSSGSVRLDDELELKVTATCATDGATIKYRVDGGEAADYTDAGIVLAGKKDGTAEYTVTVWAQKGSRTSEEVEATYTLDDTKGKTVTVSCSDTGLYAKGATPWSSSFAVTADLGGKVEVTAPARADRVFDHWVVDGEKKADETLTIDGFSTDLSIEAVYVPVVTRVDFGVDVPAAHGALADRAGYVRVGVGDDGAWTDITDYLADGAKVAWTPSAAADGTAEHNASYTASIKLADGSADDGVRYLLADSGLKLYVNGTSGEGLDRKVYVVSDKDGSKSIAAEMPSTGPYEYASHAQPGDVSLTFEQASAFAEGEKSGWDLPDQVEVTCKCGEKLMLGAVWDDVEGFDENATGTQELEVTGTVIYPSTLDNEGAPETVTVKIKVAAPDQVAAPTASLAAGTYTGTQPVELSCETEGATIRYTTDGSEPTEESPAYDGDSIEVSATMTIKAKAFRKNMAASEVSEFAYTIESGSKTDPEPTPDDGSGAGREDGGNSDGQQSDSEKAPGRSVPALVETGDAAWAIAPVAALGILAAAIGITLAKRRAR